VGVTPGPPLHLGYAEALGAALLVAGIVWFLRRRAARAAARPGVSKASAWVSLADSRLILGMFMFGLVGVGVSFGLVRSSDAYALTMATARSSERFVEVLGAPVSEGWSPSFHLQYGEPTTAELEVPVSGPKAHGTLRAAATKAGGRWRLSQLKLHLASASGEIDLLE
jgi:hypothetical protein